MSTAERKSLKLEITGRHVKVTPAIRTFTREKLAKMRKLIDGPLEVHVILNVEKHRHLAEIVAHGRQLKLSAREVTEDMYTSIGECVEKLERQAQKHKEKYSTRRRRAIPVRTPESVAAAAGEEGHAEPRGRGQARRARKSAAEAVEPGSPPRIVRTSMPRRKPMSVEEAALHVQEMDQGFIVFRNDQSQAINVLYRRRDGSLGLIEPEG